MNKNNYRVLCLFDYACTTGFSTVTQNLMPYFKKHFENSHFDIVAINYFGPTYQESPHVWVYSAVNNDILPDEHGNVDASIEKDPFGRHGFLRMMRQREYDMLFIIHDVALLSTIGQVLQLTKKDFIKENKKWPRTVCYFPVDGNLPKDQVKKLAIFDTLITYTEYGKEMLRSEFLPAKIKVIPHGVNTDHYHRLNPDDVIAFRQEFFGKNAHKVIILNNSRNNPRKDIPTSIFAFEEFQERNNGVGFYYLHTDPEDPMGWNLRSVLEQTSLVEGTDYMFRPEGLAGHGASPELMNQIYNACDLFLTTTLGEGWGLFLNECFMTMLPVVAPLHTSIKEISKNGQYIYGVDEFIPISIVDDNTKRDMCHYEAVVEKIEEAWLAIDDHNKGKIDGDHTDKISEALYYACQLQWEVIADVFINEFEVHLPRKQRTIPVKANSVIKR